MDTTGKKLIEDLNFAFPKVEQNWFLENWIWIFCGIILLMLLSVLFVKAKKRIALASVRLPHEIALQELQLLESLLKLENAREFVIRVSAIVRYYIEGRFDIHAPKRTTEEFLIEAQKSNHLEKNHQQALAKFLQACDLVKFAEYRPTIDELKDVYRTAKQFVDQTIPKVIDREAFQKKQLEQQREEEEVAA